jgi:CRP/FNR family transcriptional regulator, dissimilatory nitrate respiration regulator
VTDVADIRPDVWAAFRACRLWHTASDAAVAKLARRSRIADLPRRSVLAAEGEAADEFGLIVAGKARVFHLAADGRQITFETVGAGQPFGAVGALAGSRNPANVEAATPVTVAHVPSEALFDLLDTEPRVAHTLVADLANRVVNFTAVVTTLSLDVPSRVAGYVFQRALQVGKPTAAGLEVTLGMKKGDLAMALGTVPETLSRAFSKLAAEGIMEVHGQLVTVLDVRALAALSSGYEESDGPDH